MGKTDWELWPSSVARSDTGMDSIVTLTSEDLRKRESNKYLVPVERKKRRRRSTDPKEPISLISKRQAQTEHRWNVFRSVPRSERSFEPKWTNLAAQLLKILAYVFVHALVLFSGIIAKLLLMLMAANLQSESTFIPCVPAGIEGELIRGKEGAKPEKSATIFYWGLWAVFCVPELLLLLRSIRIVLFSVVPNPSVFLFFGAFVIESMRTVGVFLLFFFVLPDLDSVRAAMLFCAVAVVPCMLSFAGNVHLAVKRKRNVFRMVVDFLALVGQASALVIWSMFDESLPTPLMLPGSLLLISVGFWDNYVSKSSEFRLIRWLGKVKERMGRSRYKSHLFLTVWKCALGLFLMVMAGGYSHDVQLLTDFEPPSFFNQTLSGMTDDQAFWAQHTRNGVWVAVVASACSYLCYWGSKFACRVRMDLFSFAVPSVFISPAVVATLFALCTIRPLEPCYVAHFVPDTMFWRCDNSHLLSEHYSYVYLAWLCSYIWIVSHVFTQKGSRLSKTDTGLMVDQSVLLTRRRNHAKRLKTRVLRDVEDGTTTTGKSFSNRKLIDFEDVESLSGSERSAVSKTSMSMLNSQVDSLTKIYICATMWHETSNEMLQMLKSVVRMDEDQSARRNAQKYLKVIDPDYYELEAHVFFDDAWTDDAQLGRVPNDFVRQFFGVVSTAVREVHKTDVALSPPVLIDTAYGGRIIFALPGDNRLFVHLKDKTKVKNKKRWSQVMYMYYLLGHRIMDVISETARKQLLADNTYILAIDGDSKFEPSAVQKLVDLMKKELSLGSACGRIHPIGKGMMVWYQKFEYAIAHWFQKAAEHVFGCVLCAPGCFSLFRGSALMDDNVMNKYTKVPTEPRHFVQYDQGEDRWLSTLLLKQGYRIEYAAAADAETYAPEGFDEFYNQRRRWTPSSIANTLDLLGDYKRASKNNDSISRLYIAYQMLVILFSLVGPAIIFTMLVFAQVAVFGVAAWTVLWWNLTPVLLFAVLCFIAGSEAQLVFAKMVSIIYAFIMMAVIVATAIQVVLETPLAPTSMFVLTMCVLFLSAAFLHPVEFINILYGSIFFLMIPCTYVFMMLYSLINLNVINWGTREAAAKATGRDADQTLLQRWKRRLWKTEEKNGKRFQNFGCSRLCSCALFSQTEESQKTSDQRLFWIGDKLERLDEKMSRMEEQTGLRRVPITVLSRPDSAPDQSDLMAEMSASRKNSGFLSPIQEEEDHHLKSENQVTPSEQPKLILTEATPLEGSDRRVRSPAVDVTPSSGRQNKQLENSRSEKAVRTFSESGMLADSNDLGALYAGVDRRLTHSDGDYLHSSGSDRDHTDNDSVGSAEDLVELARRQRRYKRHSEHGSNVPKWMNIDYLSNCTYDILDEEEDQFWNEFIPAYLKPVETSAEEQGRIAVGLRSLRNGIAFGLLLLNSLVVLAIYLLQKHKDILSFKWTPYAGFVHRKFSPSSGQLEKTTDPLAIEPIGFIVIFFLLLILVVQTCGMVAHRFHTLLHVLATTTLTVFRKPKPEDDERRYLQKHAVEIARNMQKLEYGSGRRAERARRSTRSRASDESNVSGVVKKRTKRRVVFKLEKARRTNASRHKYRLDKEFEQRFFNIDASDTKQLFQFATSTRL